MVMGGVQTVGRVVVVSYSSQHVEYKTEAGGVRGKKKKLPKRVQEGVIQRGLITLITLLVVALSEAIGCP